MKAEGLRRILIIKKVDNKAKGEYECDCGTDVTKASMNIEARIIKIMRPLFGVEIFEDETARFEVDISETDVHPQWKLNGETLLPSPVSYFFCI
uniref:Immunoglobulin I-set domain-containing protein n=1 Tax=Callorhinchus milii TaxID=7868 RepID=A0A4W3IYL9_CALMI